MLAGYPDLMSVENMQKALGIGRSMAYRLIKDGVIKYLRVGKAIKIPKYFLIDFIVRSCYNNDIATNLPLLKEVKLNDGK
jgi:excisionase family DNA binding protein